MSTNPRVPPASVSPIASAMRESRRDRCFIYLRTGLCLPFPCLLGDELLFLGFLGVAHLLILLLEAVHASFGIDQLLATGEERVATGANFDADVAFVGRAGTERVAAGANHVDFFVG